MSYEKQTWTNNVSSIDETKMNHIEDGIYDNSIDLEALYDKVLYKANDTFSTSYTAFTGFVSNNTTEIQFSVVLPKRLDNITTITITDLRGTLRGNKGYLNSDSTVHDFLSDTSNYTITYAKKSENMIVIIINKSTAFTNVDNNTPVSIAGYIGLTFK